ncbi:hypothetical protein BZB76_4939 [Actinomadura pelletieri DSM 43383]|uniref:Uncharacterized protein n=1 Tax=Actinomadura pelletieri DSM 43383 TaxID=1120940 RepID=A0A495QJF7_9ACTN|nr:hypothetical protein [Actinomadura pelletieri]RKS72124.1 hypothetical protein BZB76_4939 [Actinomadura pelletieri DSM 43383]
MVMLRVALITVIAVVTLGSGVANAVETRRFLGEGGSDFGLALTYARAHAKRQAEQAGFTDCVEIWKREWAYTAKVLWECTR